MQNKLRKHPLGEISYVIRGVSFNRAEGSSSPVHNHIPILRAGNIQDNLITDKDLVWVPTSRVSQQQYIKKSDLIMCTSSGSAHIVGKCAMAESDLNESFGAFCVNIRAKKGKCNSHYLLHFLRSPAFTNWSKGSAGINIKNIRKSELEAFLIPLPPLNEQKYIASILDKADAIRRKRRQAIKLADEFLRSVFLDMFGDPVTNPKGYNSVLLGDLVEIISGGTPSKAEKSFWNGMFPWVSPKDMKSIIINDSIDKISENVFSETPLKRIPQKSILIVIRGMILVHTIPIAITEKEVAINQDIKALIPKQSIVPQFLLWSLIILHNFLLSKVSTAAHGTKRLDMESLRNIDILLPTIVQQYQFVEIANKFSSVKSGQTLSLEQNKAMFNSLSQRAFRGEL